MKSKSVLPLVATSEITIFIFTVSKNGLFMNVTHKSTVAHTVICHQDGRG